jgi:hypothetical protein
MAGIRCGQSDQSFLTLQSLEEVSDFAASELLDRALGRVIPPALALRAIEMLFRVVPEKDLSAVSDTGQTSRRQGALAMLPYFARNSCARGRIEQDGRSSSRQTVALPRHRRRSSRRYDDGRPVDRSRLRSRRTATSMAEAILFALSADADAALLALSLHGRITNEIGEILLDRKISFALVSRYDSGTRREVTDSGAP